MNKNIYIGCDLHKDWRGKGLSYLSYLEFIPKLFNTHNLHKISLEVLSTNIVAYNLYKKIGFIEEGRKRDEAWSVASTGSSPVNRLKTDDFLKLELTRVWLIILSVFLKELATVEL